MKKIVLSIVFAVSAYSINVNAQVGINVDSPSSTLDITAKNATGTASSVDGLLVPRVNRQRAQSMTGVPVSTMVYVTGVVSGSQTGTAINMDSVGYYYFNGTVWVKMKSTDTPDINIYSSDGTLAGNRVVSQGTNTLAFNATAVNAFSVDGSTLSVDALNNRVGIGTTAPHAQLHLGSSVANRKIVMYETADNDNEFYGFGVNPGVMRYQADRTSTDHVFYAGVTGGASSNELMRIKGTGNVGIGTNAPTANLDVDGAVRVRTMNIASGSTLVTPVYSDASGNLVKAASSTYMGVTTTAAVVVGSGATATLINGLIDSGVYRFVVTVGDGCAYNTVMEFFVSTYAANSNFAIRGLNGLLSNGTSKLPTISEPTRNSTVVTWTGKPNCSDGANGNSLNYTLTMPNSSTINLTNNGNVSMQYIAVITRLN